MDYIAKPLTELFNLSMSKGKVPARWKEAYVTPIYKKGDKRKPNNYRPVSLTSTSCKMMESFIRDVIVDHMDRHELYTDNQYGFRKGRSCNTQLLDVSEDWYKELDSGRSIDCIYLD